MNNTFEEKIISLLNKLGIKLINKETVAVFAQALTHTSYSNEHKNCPNYQYLEFLGDALIQYVVTKEIFFQYKHLDEGKASKLRSSLVNRKILAQLATSLGIIDCIRYAKKSFNNGQNEKIVSDFFESFVAAIYITQGEKVMIEFIAIHLFPFIEEFIDNDLRDPKSEFQEYIQSYKNTTITYSNKPYNNGFESTLIVDGQIYGIGFGNSKKEAEKQAAQDALNKLK